MNVLLNDHPHLLTLPSVFAVGEEYQIFTLFDCAVTVGIRVGERVYYDHANGVIRSGRKIHSVRLPISALDNAREYTVIYRKVIERKPYFPILEEEKELTVAFRPLRTDKPNIYHISDTHTLIDEPVRCGSYFGEELDLLILNGDISDYSESEDSYAIIYKLAGSITNGTIPCVFSRGNHDTRGIFAENMSDYTPTRGGLSYYTFRLGGLWGLVLDTGEDKPDDGDEYGGTVCFGDFKVAETEYLKNVISEGDFNSPDIKHRLIIAHIPFTRNFRSPFNIDVEMFTEWARLIREHIQPSLMLCGHKHTNEINPVGGEFDQRGQPCPVIIGSTPLHDKERPNFIGCAVTLDADRARVVFNDSYGKILRDEIIPLGYPRS